MARTSTKKADPGEPAAYVALTYIEHNQEPYDKGDTILLTAAEAAPLLDCNPPAIEWGGDAAKLRSAVEAAEPALDAMQISPEALEKALAEAKAAGRAEAEAAAQAKADADAAAEAQAKAEADAKAAGEKASKTK